MAPDPAPAAAAGDPLALLRDRRYVVLLAYAAVVGFVISFAAWGFLEGNHQLQHWLYDILPGDLGYRDGPPLWWSLPLLSLGGVIVALAVWKLPGSGGHLPADAFAK